MLKDPTQKYRPFKPIGLTDRTWPDQTITSPPIWASVDLRDGNQALIEPMDPQRKLRMFNCLISLGFKEIEVGFPSASQADFDFVRKLIEDDLVPDDVDIQVLTQAREPLIERTFEAVRGAKRAIVHVYNATAPVMRRVVFGLDRDGVIKIATDHAAIVKRLAAEQPKTKWRFEYSPEMFSGTELDFSKAICDAVVDTFAATPDQKLIINLPSTVECASANIFADQIEWMHRHLAKRDSVILSIHPHNDRGTGAAAAEFALMAGADRLEGCLFGNGERTGNLDLITIALNMYSQGIHPGLQIDNIDEIRRTVEYCNQLPVHPRHPYVGDLVYTSFSGSHQDAIKKAFSARQEGEIWDMPYLPLDPKDLGRSYEAVIRVNSQSGKGGIAYLLEAEYGISLPRRLQIEFSRVVQKHLDDSGRELSAENIWQIFHQEYLNNLSPVEYLSHRADEDSTRQSNRVKVHLNLRVNGESVQVEGAGNGPIDGLVNSLSHVLEDEVKVLDYHEHAIDHGANATAVCFIELQIAGGNSLFGVGIDPNIVTASFKAIASGINRKNRKRTLTFLSETTLAK